MPRFDGELSGASQLPQVPPYERASILERSPTGRSLLPHETSIQFASAPVSILVESVRITGACLLKECLSLGLRCEVGAVAVGREPLGGRGRTGRRTVSVGCDNDLRKTLLGYDDAFHVPDASWLLRGR